MSDDARALDAPATESPHLRYRSGLAEGVLLYQRCHECGDAVFPPRLVCPHCGTTELDPAQSSGSGTVYSTTTVSQRDAESYAVSLIDLDDGFRMMSTVVGIPAEEVRIGQRVVFVAEQGEAPRATFRPAED